MVIKKNYKYLKRLLLFPAVEFLRQNNRKIFTIHVVGNTGAGFFACNK